MRPHWEAKPLLSKVCKVHTSSTVGHVGIAIYQNLASPSVSKLITYHMSCLWFVVVSNNLILVALSFVCNDHLSTWCTLHSIRWIQSASFSIAIVHKGVKDDHTKYSILVDDGQVVNLQNESTKLGHCTTRWRWMSSRTWTPDPKECALNMKLRQNTAGDESPQVHLVQHYWMLELMKSIVCRILG